MRNPQKIITFFLIASIAVFCVYCDTKEKISDTKPIPVIPDKYVVMISMDGYRWDYPDFADTPVLDSVERNGVKAVSVKPSFPTKTFPNHYSMATGLYPENHGIVNNSFYANDINKAYRISDRDAVENPDFYLGEPIWLTAAKQNVLSASFFWIGSEAPIKGMQPTYWKRYDGSVKFKDRIDTVIQWLQLPVYERPHLLLCYFNEPDHTGHDYGPESREIKDLVSNLDQLMGYFFRELNKLEIKDSVNVIITSDHGMSSFNKDTIYVFDDYLDEDWYDYINGANPVYSIDAAEGYEDSVVNALNAVHGINAWRKGNVPERFHYNNSERLQDVIVLADLGKVLQFDRELNYNASHGYDNEYKEMHNIFYAIGPDFKKNYSKETFENVNIYPILAKILNLEPAIVDGDLENVKDIFGE